MLPDLFELFIGGYIGSSYHVEWSSGELIYTAMTSGYKEEEKVIIAPTPAQWQ